MDCTDVRGHLHGYLDQELERSNVLELERHLDSCDACRTEIARFSASGALKADAPDQPRP